MKHYPVEYVYLYTSRHFPPCSYSEKQCLYENCPVYSTFLVSDNYLGSNKCSVDNNFHLLVNLLFPIALLFRLLSVWNIIQLRMSIFTLHVISAWFLFRIAVLCEITVLSTVPLKFLATILVQTRVLLIITYISGMNVLFPSVLLFRVLCVWNIIKLRIYIFKLHVIFPLVPIQKSSALCDNCLV